MQVTLEIETNPPKAQQVSRKAGDENGAKNKESVKGKGKAKLAEDFSIPAELLE